MASVVAAILGPCVKMIAKEAQGEVSILLGVSNNTTKLKHKMEILNPFIPDAEIRRVTDPRVQRWYSNLVNTKSDIDDIIDICKLEDDKRRESRIGSLEEKVSSCFRPLLFFLYNPKFAHHIGRRIKKLQKRLDKITKEAVALNFNTDLSSHQDMRMLREAENSSRRSISEFDESAIVGKNIENDTKLLVQELITHDDHDIKVLSIVGMGGIGKTTFAQKIFNEKTIQEHFKTRIWLGCRHFDETELLRSAITQAGGDPGNGRDMSLLVRNLSHALSARKFLIVMDDMCSEEVWHNLLSVPVRNASHMQQGSRVMITTRFEDMAVNMGTAVHRYHVSPLDAEDAWCLLKKQLTPNQVVGIDHLKNIGMDILKRCDGLPHAIKVIGGLLRTKYPSEGDWKTVLNSPAWSVAGLPPQLDSRLYLSYGELSPQLKQCFVYCSLIPKGKDIEQDVVARMWISEGFIQSPDGNITGSSNEYGLEDIAIDYYHDLRKRNLIETGSKYSLTGYKCTLHDVVRSFAEHVTREEFMVVAGPEQLLVTGGNDIGKLVCGLSIRYVISVAEWAALKRQKALRTLIINSKVNFQPGDSLKSFSSLRVLYICSTDCNGLVASSLSRLKHLRYLHLEETDISMLPDDIHKMKFLLYITVIKCKKLEHLPTSIIELVQLRSLDIRGSNVSAMPNGFGRLTNLMSLYGFQAHMDMDAGSSSLSKQLVPLSHLRELTLENLGKVTASSMVEKDTISTKDHLEYLVLNYSTSGHTVGPHGGEAEQQQQQSVVEDVLEKLRPPNSINNLTLKGGYVGRQLPNWMHAPESAVFTSLRFLTLENLHCCTQLPDGLCYLVSLEMLTIFQAPDIKSIGNEFQVPSSMTVGVSDSMLAPFPKLKKLQLSGLCEWEEWEWNDPEQGGLMKDIIAMPCLELLHIKNCKLRCLPPGLANSNRHALRVLALYQLNNLTSLENFPSVADLDVFDCHELKRISGFSRLQKIRIIRSKKLQVLEGVPILNIKLKDVSMETLPEYLISVNPSYLELCCSEKLRESLLPGSSEWMKISHIQVLNIV